MATSSKIQWTDATWNIARGCTKVDADCKFCYMYRDSLKGTRYNPKGVQRTKTVFDLPLKLKDPSRIFASSLTDFFHPEIDSYRDEAWEIIRKCPQHTFQILTKRPERIKDHLPDDWGSGYPNVWLGTSIGSQAAIQRVRDLIDAPPAMIKFLSVEPLHDEVSLWDTYFPYRLIRHVPVKDRTRLIDLLDWVIIGGESGNENGKYRYRPCEMGWILKIIEECNLRKKPVFVKQLGTHLSKEVGLKDRHGGDMDEWPEDVRVREFPPNYF